MNNVFTQEETLHEEMKLNEADFCHERRLEEEIKLGME